MKLANVAVVGLVVLGVFGVVLACQTVSSVGEVSSGKEVLVGQCMSGRVGLAEVTFCSDIPATTDCSGFVNFPVALKDRQRTCSCGHVLESHKGCLAPENQGIAGQIGPGCTSSPGIVVSGDEGPGEDKSQGPCPSPYAIPCKNVTSQPACPKCKTTKVLFECLPAPPSIPLKCPGSSPSLPGHAGC